MNVDLKFIIFFSIPASEISSVISSIQSLSDISWRCSNNVPRTCKEVSVINIVTFFSNSFLKHVIRSI